MGLEIAINFILGVCLLVMALEAGEYRDERDILQRIRDRQEREYAELVKKYKKLEEKMYEKFKNLRD